MSQKAEKPTLSGQRLKTRKRDEKEKFDRVAFRDAVLPSLEETEGDLDKVSKFLDSAGSRLDYRRYAETLLDILFAGGILAPGGSIQDDGNPEKKTRTKVCLFGTKDDLESIKAYYDVFYRLIRRYKYIEKTYEEELKKLIMFLKGFTPEERDILATLIGLSLACGLGNAVCLAGLFENHLVKDGIALEFARNVFKAWLTQKDCRHLTATLRKILSEEGLLVRNKSGLGISLDFAKGVFQAWLKTKDISSIHTALKRANIEDRLLELLPVSKRSMANFEKYFLEADLKEIVDFQREKQSSNTRKEMMRSVNEMIEEKESVKEIELFIKQEMEKTGMTEHETIVMIWGILMRNMEWNKKEELVAEQALKHLYNYVSLFAAVSNSGRAQLALLVKIQEYCYDNMNFMKVFQKIVVLLYKNDVLSEDAILRWYKEAHSSKGKSIFLEQMKKFVEWLENAEEESESGEED